MKSDILKSKLMWDKFIIMWMNCCFCRWTLKSAVSLSLPIIIITNFFVCWHHNQITIFFLSFSIIQGFWINLIFTNKSQFWYYAEINHKPFWESINVPFPTVYYRCCRFWLQIIEISHFCFLLQKLSFLSYIV